MWQNNKTNIFSISRLVWFSFEAWKNKTWDETSGGREEIGLIEINQLKWKADHPHKLVP